MKIRNILLATLISAATSCRNQQPSRVAHCDLHGDALTHSTSYEYAGLPAPSYSGNIERFMLIGNTADSKHVRRVWYSDKPGDSGRYSKVEFQICATCQNLYNEEFDRVSNLSEKQFQKEFSVKVKEFDTIDVPPMPEL